MKRRLRRELRLLQASAIGSVLALGFIAFAAFTRVGAPEKFDEITVQRLNVVDANGTLRLVLAGKDRMHPGVIDGKTIEIKKGDVIIVPRGTPHQRSTENKDFTMLLIKIYAEPLKKKP